MTTTYRVLWTHWIGAPAAIMQSWRHWDHRDYATETDAVEAGKGTFFGVQVVEMVDGEIRRLVAGNPLCVNDLDHISKDLGWPVAANATTWGP